MAKKVSATVLLLLFAFTQVSLATDEMILSGSFITTFVNGSTALHASGIMEYDPSSNTFSNNFGGGVYTTSEPFILDIQVTPLGTYISGGFSFVGSNYEYSANVLEYDASSNDYNGLNGGIDGNVDINWVGQYVIFSGEIASIESLDLAAYLAGTEQVTPPDIVKMDSNNNYSPLQDPNNVFKCVNGARDVVNTQDGKTLFVYCREGLYSWDETNYFKLLNTVALGYDLVVDAQNNLYSQVSGEIYIQDQEYCSMAIVNATTDYSTVSYANITCSCDTPLVIIPWSEGVLIYHYSAQTSNSCGQQVFDYFNPITGQILPNAVPKAPGSFASVIQGAGNDLWALQRYYGGIIYYYSASRNQWSTVNLAPYSFSVNGIAWDPVNNYLLVLEHDYSGSSLLLKLTTDSFPPANPQVLITNKIADKGEVYSTTSIKQQNSGNYDYYVGGLFNVVGNGVEVVNAAVYSNGVWSPLPLKQPGTGKTYGISSMASYGSNLFYTFLIPSGSGSQGTLPVGGINTLTGESIVTPTPVESFGSINCVVAINQTTVFYGGSFSEARVSGGSTAGYVIGYRIDTQVWFGIGFPENSYAQINSLTANTVDGVRYLVISGNFQLTLDRQSYNDIAFYNLDKSAFVHESIVFGTYTHIYDTLFDDTGIVYMAGQIQLLTQTTVVPLASTNFYNTSSLIPIGEYGINSAPANSIALYTASNGQKTLYVAGTLTDFAAGEGTIPLMYGPPALTGEWNVGGTNVLFQYYYGRMHQLIYATGGKGLNSING